MRQGGQLLPRLISEYMGELKNEHKFYALFCFLAFLVGYHLKGYYYAVLHSK